MSSFTFTPSAFGATGSVVTADTAIVSDFAVVTATSTSFTETGYLSVSSFQNGGTFAPSTGLNSTYGVYVSFTATGSIAANPLNNTLTGLTYSVYGYTGAPATFTASVTAGVGSVTKSATTDTLLGTGSLVPGINPFGATIIGGVAYGSFVTANELLFTNVGGAFSPISGGSAQFANTGAQMLLTSSGFVVNGGGGSINLIAAPVPEPETYALMLGGLAAVGFVARRRSNG